MIVRKGMKGSSVKRLQKVLGVKIDGAVGPITLGALQKRLGLPSLGGVPSEIALTPAQMVELKLLDEVLPYPPESKWPYGVDISGWQDKHEVRFNEVGSLLDPSKTCPIHISFAWVKISEGTSYVSPDAAWQIKGLMEKKIPVGGYHFARLDQDPKAQAKHFFETHRKLFGDHPVLPPALDLEWQGDKDSPHNAVKGPAAVKWIEAYDAEWTKLTAAVDATYTGVNWWLEKVRVPVECRAVKPLWEARHRAKFDNKLPKGWAKATFWQFTAKHKATGFDDLIDANRFLGTQAELAAMLKPVLPR